MKSYSQILLITVVFWTLNTFSAVSQEKSKYLELTEQNIDLLTGTFGNTDSTNDVLHFWNYMTNHRQLHLEENGEYTLVWEWLDEHKLKVSLIENDSVLDSRIYRGKIKNSQFETKAKFGIKGIPAVAWLFSWSTVNLKIDSNNRMVVHRHITGLLVLFIMPMFGADGYNSMTFSKEI